MSKSRPFRSLGFNKYIGKHAAPKGRVPEPRESAEEQGHPRSPAHAATMPRLTGSRADAVQPGPAPSIMGRADTSRPGSGHVNAPRPEAPRPEAIPEPPRLDVAPEATGLEATSEAIRFDVTPEAPRLDVAPEPPGLAVAPEVTGLEATSEAPGLDVAPEATRLDVTRPDLIAQDADVTGDEQDGSQPA